MSLSALLFLVCCLTGFAAGLLAEPIYAILAYALTYFFNPSPQFNWWGADVPQLRWALLAAGVIAVSMVLNKDSLSKVSPFSFKSTKFLIAFFVLMILISPFAVAPDIHFQKIYDFFRFVVIYIFLIKVLSDERGYRYFTLFYVLCCFILSYQAWTHGRIVAGRLEGIGPADSVGSDAFSLLLVACTPFIAAYILRGKLHEKALCILAAPFILKGIILCSSRGAFLALMVSGLLFVWIYRHGISRRTVIVVGLIGALSFYHLLSGIYIQRLLTLKQSKAVAGEDNGRRRIKFWIVGLEMAKDHPLGAGGWGYVTLSPKYLPESDLTKTGSGAKLRAAHNTAVEILVDYGVLGLILFSGFLFCTFIQLHKIRRFLKRDIDDDPDDHPAQFIYGQAAALESALAGLLVGSIFVDRLACEALYWLCALAPVLTYLCMKRQEHTLIHERWTEEVRAGISDNPYYIGSTNASNQSR